MFTYNVLLRRISNMRFATSEMHKLLPSLVTFEGMLTERRYNHKGKCKDETGSHISHLLLFLLFIFRSILFFISIEMLFSFYCLLLTISFECCFTFLFFFWFLFLDCISARNSMDCSIELRLHFIMSPKIYAQQHYKIDAPYLRACLPVS